MLKLVFASGVSSGATPSPPNDRPIDHRCAITDSRTTTGATTTGWAAGATVGAAVGAISPGACAWAAVARRRGESERRNSRGDMTGVIPRPVPAQPDETTVARSHSRVARRDFLQPLDRAAGGHQATTQPGGHIAL